MINNNDFNSRYKRAYRHRRYNAKVQRARFKFVVSSLVIVTVIAAGTIWVVKHNQLENPVYGKPQMSVSSEVQGETDSAAHSNESSAQDTGAQPASSSSAKEGADFTEWNKACDWKLLVVNYNNKIPQGYTVDAKDMDGMQVGTRIYSALQDMRNAAAKDGITLWISSAYRSTELQQQLFDNEVSANVSKGYSKSEAEKIAATAVAIPGTSEHSTGLSVDLNEVSENFENSPAYKWLSQHAAEYGFVQRYAQDKQDITHIIYEPWHYRYVGLENAKTMNSKNMCLEEYVQYLMNNQ